MPLNQLQEYVDLYIHVKENCSDVREVQKTLCRCADTMDLETLQEAERSSCGAAQCQASRIVEIGGS